jgi:predicted DNA repair protein MutK
VIGTAAMLMVGGHIVRVGIPPVHELAQRLVAGLPLATQGLAGTAADMLVGGLVGLFLVGIAKTGVIQGAWARLRGRGQAA